MVTDRQVRRLIHLMTLDMLSRIGRKWKCFLRFWLQRYERGSVMITSNLPFSKWESIFKDPMTTAAAIDRLVHHRVILDLNVPSYRMEQARQRKK